MKINKSKLKLYFNIIFISFWSLAPVYWALRTSFLSKSDLLTSPVKYIPLPVSFEHYAELFGLNGNQQVWNQFKDALLNSLITSSATTIIVILIAIFTGYAFARLEFKGKNIIFSGIIITMALPAYAVMIPLYKIIIQMGLIDTQTGITLIYTSAFLPLAVWLLRSFFIAIPKELEEAALMDGASKLRAMLTILPLAMPGIIAAAILTFLNAWSQFMIPLIFAPSNTKPVTVLITEFVGKNYVDYGLMTATGLITILPPILIVLFLNKYLVSGLTAGAVKG